MQEASDPEYVFVRVVEAGSLRAVAAELGVDPSSVSRKVAALEARLGTTLLRRSTKRSEPTEAGRRYYEGIRRLLGERAQLEAEVSGLTDAPRGRLRVAAPVDFGARFVAPVLADLLAEAPDLDAELVLGSGFADLTEAGLDAAVRIGTLTDSALIAKRAGSVPRVIVASEGYAAQHGLPKTPEALGAHPFVFYRAGQRRLTLRLERRGKTAEVAVGGRVAANSVTAIRQLVLAGAGLHHGPLWAFAEDLRQGRMVSVLPGWATEAFPIHVVWTETPYLPARTRVFADRFAASVGAADGLAS